ncbi:MAG: chromosome segregation SMC family protein, partial [Chitinophagales bacterium]
MRLKSLDIKGFKSFADKTVLHFNENVTGIVGPNGCGKSNTIDAIRWVLGEQKSKALRLEKMDNLIFNGSRKRKPSSRAEVALTFDNTRNLLPTEFSTVTVSRIIYRTGESEYRLNDVKCRLKDITTLFMDTGISSDSYAIIELKMIDEILNDKDNSRRKLFEQAAGISKYKIRKKQTFQKLKAADADLERVKDLLFEIEKNLKTLERQAKRAKRYYELKETYKTLSIELALHDLSEYQVKFTQLQEHQQQESEKKLAHETKITQLETGLEKQKAIVITREKYLSQTQKNLNQLLARLQESENKKNLAFQNGSFLRERREALYKQINTAQTLVESLGKEVAFLTKDEVAAHQRQQNITSQKEDFQHQLDKIRHTHRQKRQNLEQLQSVFRNVERSFFDVEKKIAVKTAQKENLSFEIKDNRIKFQSQTADLTQLQQNWEKATEDAQEAQSKLDELLTEEKEIQKQLRVEDQQIDQKRQ